MALDKKQIALTVVGIVAGLALTYLLWMRSQQDSANAAAQAAATAAANAEEQEQESQQFDAASTGLSDSGSGSGIIYEQSSPTTSGVTSPTDSSTSDITSLVSTLLGAAGTTTASVPANQLIPEVNVSDGTSSLSGIDTSAAQILGSAPPSTVSSTTSTGQTYGATSSPVAGTTMPGDSSSGIWGSPAAPVTPVGGGGNPSTAILTPAPTNNYNLDGSSPVAVATPIAAKALQS